MAIFVERPASPALWNLCRSIQDNMRPGSRVQNKLRGDLRTIAIEDHTDMLLSGVDRYGRPRAALAERTLKDPKRAGGPSLIPRGRQSRFVTNFEALWESDSGQGVMFLVCRYRDILSKKGKPFAQYHMTGARKAGTKWVLPRRDTGGVTPAGWRRIKARFALVPGELARTGGGTWA